MKITKTNAARQLDRAGVAYDLSSYEVDESDLSGTHVAHQLGVAPSVVFKTLVLSGERTGHFVCLIPSDAGLDLKKAARAAGDKSCGMIAVKDLLPLTGYIRGGCSPLAMKKRFRTYVDSSAQHCDRIFISAGVRGTQIYVSPVDLVGVVGADWADLISDTNDTLVP